MVCVVAASAQPHVLPSAHSTPSSGWSEPRASGSFLLALLPGSLRFALALQLLQHECQGSPRYIPSLNSWQVFSLSDWALTDPLLESWLHSK